MTNKSFQRLKILKFGALGLGWGASEASDGAACHHEAHVVACYAGGIWAVVDFDTSKYEGKAEKINIIVPRKLLSKIDAYESNHPGETRSGS